MKELLANLSLVSWLVDLLSLLAFYYLAKMHSQRIESNLPINSSFVTLCIVQVLGSLMLGYEAFLNAYSEENPGYHWYVNFFWYMGFAAFYLFGILSIRKVHVAFQLPLGVVARCCTLAFYAAGILQLAQYSEILIFNTDQNLDAIYRAGIPTINIATSFTYFLLGVIAIYTVHKSKDGIEGLKWRI